MRITRKKNKVSEYVEALDTSLTSEITDIENKLKVINISKARKHQFPTKLAYLKGLIRARYITRMALNMISPTDIDLKTKNTISAIVDTEFRYGKEDIKGGVK